MISSIKNDVEFRNTNKKNIYHLFYSQFPTTDTEFLTKIARQIERCIFNYTIHEAKTHKIVRKWDNQYFIQIYINRFRSIYTNIKSNQDFATQIIQGKIPIKQLCSITHLEIAPELWKNLIDKKIQRDVSKCTGNDQANTDMYECKKCKSRRCQYYEMQVRSADEGCSVYVSCLDCGKHWRIN